MCHQHFTFQPDKFGRLLLRCGRIGSSQQPYERTHAVEIVTEPEVLVVTVLVVVRVDQRDDDEGYAERFDQLVGGYATAHQANSDRLGGLAVARKGLSRCVLNPCSRRRFHFTERGIATSAQGERSDLRIFCALVMLGCPVTR